jgi:methenyltetrahydromethanopterin cyclohydrolase
MKKTCNERSVEVVRQLVEEADVLGVAVHRLGNGTLWIDCGIEVEGSLEAGRLYALACLGGMADLRFDTFDLDGITWPSLSVSGSRPLLACLGCQYAGWNIEVKGTSGTYRAMGSGPGRMRGSREPLLYRFGLRERTDDAVLALETRTPPDEETATAIAFSCAVSPGKLVLLTAPTASLVGSVQIASRVVETGFHKMIEVDFPWSAFAATGTCPFRPLRGRYRGHGTHHRRGPLRRSAWYALRSGEDCPLRRNGCS